MNLFFTALVDKCGLLKYCSTNKLNILTNQGVFYVRYRKSELLSTKGGRPQCHCSISILSMYSLLFTFVEQLQKSNHTIQIKSVTITANREMFLYLYAVDFRRVYSMTTTAKVIVC